MSDALVRELADTHSITPGEVWHIAKRMGPASEEDTLDAARYRFLRDNPLQFRAVDGAASFWNHPPASVDSFVDDAMEAAQERPRLTRTEAKEVEADIRLAEKKEMRL